MGNMSEMPGGPGGPGGPPPMASASSISSSAETNWIDVHGAGAQRSDPKSGDPAEFSEGHGPQGDAVHIYNYVRLVRNL